MPAKVPISVESMHDSPYGLQYLGAMVSVPCFLYDIKLDRYLSVSKFLKNRLGSETFSAGFSKVMDRIHPFDRLKVFTLNNAAMQVIANHHEKENLPQLDNLKFRALSQDDEWLHCLIKFDIAGYDVTGTADKLFGVFWFNEKERKRETNSRPNVFSHKECQHADQRRRGAATTITERERDVLNLISQGKGTKEIAYYLGISFHTVETHRKKLLSKFHAHNAVELMRTVIAYGIWSHP